MRKTIYAKMTALPVGLCALAFTGFPRRELITGDTSEVCLPDFPRQSFYITETVKNIDFVSKNLYTESSMFHKATDGTKRRL